MHMSIYMSIYMSIHMSVHMSAHMSIEYAHVCAHVFAQVYAHVHGHVHTRVHAHVCANVYTHGQACIWHGPVKDIFVSTITCHNAICSLLNDYDATYPVLKSYERVLAMTKAQCYGFEKGCI